MRSSIGRGRLPVEVQGEGLVGWTRACVSTLTFVATQPGQAFSRVAEPIAHLRILQYLAALRLPGWLVLLILVLGRKFDPTGGSVAQPSELPLDPAFVEALTTTAVLLVPLGVPTAYLLFGLLAHVGVSLTGGAPRSVGTTLRAVGYALAPMMLVLSVLDVALFCGWMPGAMYRGILLLLSAHFFAISGRAVAKSHSIHLIRGLASILPPAQLLFWFGLAKSLVLDGAPPSLLSSPYFVP